MGFLGVDGGGRLNPTKKKKRKKFELSKGAAAGQGG